MAHVEKSIEVNKPVSEVYNQWTQFETFPEFMENVEQVRQLDDKHLEWKAEIVEQQPNQVIAWRSTTGDKNDGAVRFQPIDGKTKVTLSLDYQPPAGALGAAADKMAQVTPGNVDQDLKNFKKFIESQGQATGAWRGTIEDHPNASSTQQS